MSHMQRARHVRRRDHDRERTGVAALGASGGKRAAVLPDQGHTAFDIGGLVVLIDHGGAIWLWNALSVSTEVKSDSSAIYLVERDLFGKPVSARRVVARGHAFSDQALETRTRAPSQHDRSCQKRHRAGCSG